MSLDTVKMRVLVLQLLRQRIKGGNKLSTSALLKEARKKGLMKQAREDAKAQMTSKPKGGVDTGGGGKTKKAKKVTRKPETEKPVRKTRRHSPTSKKTTKKTTSKKTTKKTTTKKAVRKTKRHSPQYTQEQIRAAARQAYKNKTGKWPSEAALKKIVDKRNAGQGKDAPKRIEPPKRGAKSDISKGSKGKEVGKRTSVNMEAWRDNFRKRYGRWPTKEELKARKSMRKAPVTKSKGNLPGKPKQKAKVGKHYPLVKSKGTAVGAPLPELAKKASKKTGKKVTPDTLKKMAKKGSRKSLIGLIGAAAAAALLGTYFANRGEKKAKVEPPIKGKKPISAPTFDDEGKRQVPKEKLPKGKKAPLTKKDADVRFGKGRGKKAVAQKKGAKSKFAKPETVQQAKARLRTGKSKVRGGKGFITGGEAATAAFVTTLASKVPGIHKTADSIAGFLGTRLKSLGMAGLAAASVYAIAKALAAHRKGTKFKDEVMNKTAEKKPARTKLEQGRKALAKTQKKTRTPSGAKAGRKRKVGLNIYKSMGSKAAKSKAVAARAELAEHGNYKSKKNITNRFKKRWGPDQIKDKETYKAPRSIKRHLQGPNPMSPDERKKQRMLDKKLPKPKNPFRRTKRRKGRRRRIT